MSIVILRYTVVFTVLIFLFHFLHCVPKKEATNKLLAVTLSNLNRF